TYLVSSCFIQFSYLVILAIFLILTVFLSAHPYIHTLKLYALLTYPEIMTDSTFTKSIFSNTPIITTVKIQVSNNYISWSSSVELWFMGQGYDDHLIKRATDIAATNRTTWTKIDAQLCALLWHSLDPKLLPLFQSCKTCCKVWTKAKMLYT